MTNTDIKKIIIGGTIEETLNNLNFTYVYRHDNFSLALFRTVVEIH